MKRLTAQLLLPEGWRDAALLEFPQPDAGPAGRCTISYDLDYAIEALSGDAAPLRSVAIRYPVDFAPHSERRWPAFLDDVRPGGAARRWWIARLGLGRLPEPRQELALLAEATMAPIGHLRIKEAVPAKPAAPIVRFAVAEVADRDHDFLEYAAERGAAIGGATGAGGDAPKLLLRVTADDQVWIDTWQDEPDCPDRHYLVKFPRNERSARDMVVLRSEYVYYRALAELGVETIETDGMRLEEGLREPSLWLPRFDVGRRDGREVRYGLESLYALIDAPPGSAQKHQTYLAALHAALRDQPGYDRTALTAEYLRRDLLNVVFGNSDNHGRNAGVLKTPKGMRLAPVYDFAPMKMDPMGIIRSSRWDGFERGGEIDWAGLVRGLVGYGEPDALHAALRVLAERLRDLPDRLRRLGLPRETLDFPPLGLQRTEEKLRRWGLLP